MTLSGIIFGRHNLTLRLLILNWLAKAKPTRENQVFRLSIIKFLTSTGFKAQISKKLEIENAADSGIELII